MPEEEITQLPLFGSWLYHTRLLQTTSFGTDPGELQGVERADFITWNYAELCIELGEMMNEFPGHKTWVTDRSVLNRDEFIAEAVDAMHFLGNILVAVHCTDAEFNNAYIRKMAKNAARMASGTYDGVSDKCPQCKRELVRFSDSSPEIDFCPRHGKVK